MPTRILRDGILSSRHVAGLSDSAEILYRRLMSVVDDYGRGEADIDLIRARCFPLQYESWKNGRILKALAELSATPLVTVYYHKDKQLLQINNFGQRTQSKPKFPAPEECVDSKGLPFSTVIHRDSRGFTAIHGDSREITVQSESESESESESNMPIATAMGAAEWFTKIFWVSWPVKENKASAEVAALKVKSVDYPAIMAGLAQQSARIKAMERPIHAATWLNQRRWEDQPHVPETAPLFSVPKVEPWVDTYKLEAEARERAARENA